MYDRRNDPSTECQPGRRGGWGSETYSYPDRSSQNRSSVNGRLLSRSSENLVGRKRSGGGRETGTVTTEIPVTTGCRGPGHVSLTGNHGHPRRRYGVTHGTDRLGMVHRPDLPTGGVPGRGSWRTVPRSTMVTFFNEVLNFRTKKLVTSLSYFFSPSFITKFYGRRATSVVTDNLTETNPCQENYKSKNVGPVRGVEKVRETYPSLPGVGRGLGHGDDRGTERGISNRRTETRSSEKGLFRTLFQQQ